MKIFIEAVVINISLCIDAFVTGVAYGAERIKLPLNSMVIINIICTAFLAFSLLAGGLIGAYISAAAARWLSFSLLSLIGVIKLLGQLNSCRDPIEIDRDGSRHISSGEAALLAIALSADGLAVGFGAGLDTQALFWIIGLSLITDPAAIILGKQVGKRLVKKSQINMGFLSGVLLIVLAFVKLSF